MPHEVRAFRSGNSTVMTIPKSVVNLLQIQPGKSLWIQIDSTRSFRVLLDYPPLAQQPKLRT